MIHWDKQDPKVFLNILKQLEESQEVEIDMTDEGFHSICSYDELRQILPPRNENTEITKQELEELLQVFMPSEEMRAYLSTQKLRNLQIQDMILGAPVPLKTKAKYMHRLICKDDILHSILDKVSSDWFKQMYGDSWEDLEPVLKSDIEWSFAAHDQAIQEALNALDLKPGEILCLEEVEFNERRMKEEVAGGSMPFLSLDAALRYLRHEIDYEGWEEDAPFWTLLQKWVPGENGEMSHLYTYCLIRDEVVYFEKLHRDESEYWEWSADDGYHTGEGDGALALPIPYHAGDIVEVDCLPFAPVRHVLILEEGNGSNTLCLYPTTEGKWTTGFFERGQIMDCYTPALSPLYRISLYSGYLPRNEQLLKSVQTYIGGSAENGKRLMDAFYECELSGMKEKKLLALIGKTKKPDILLEYKAEHQICLGDVEGIWPYDNSRTRAAVMHCYDDVLIFALEKITGKNRRIVVWDKDEGEVSAVAHDLGCRDVVRFENRYFTLSVIEQPATPTILIVRKEDDMLEFGSPVYRKVFDSHTPMEDVHFEVVGSELYIFLNGKQFVRVAIA